MFERLTKLIILLAACLALSSCSTKLTYNFLDWWMSWSLRSYVTLDQQQRHVLTQQLEAFHHWHRQQELPRYRDLLIEIQQRLHQGPITEAELQAYTNRGIERWEYSLTQLIAPGASLLATLSDKQVEELSRNMTRRLEAFREDQVDISAEKLRSKRIKRMRKLAVSWVGKLDKQQRALIDTWAEQLTPDRRLNLEERLRWQQAFETLLQQRQQPELATGTEQLFLNAQQDWPTEYRDSVIHNQRQTHSLLVQLHTSLSEQQHRMLNRTLQGYIDDFGTLASLNTP